MYNKGLTMLSSCSRTVSSATCCLTFLCSVLSFSSFSFILLSVCIMSSFSWVFASHSRSFFSNFCCNSWCSVMGIYSDIEFLKKQHYFSCQTYSISGKSFIVLQTFSHFLCLLFPLFDFIFIDQPADRMTHIIKSCQEQVKSLFSWT